MGNLSGSRIPLIILHIGAFLPLSKHHRSRASEVRRLLPKTIIYESSAFDVGPNGKLRASHSASKSYDLFDFG